MTNERIVPNIQKLKDDIVWQVENLRKYRVGNKRKSMCAVVGTAAISALTTLVLGLGQFKFGWEALPQVTQIIALFLSFSATVISAWDAHFRHKDLWVMQARSVHRLYRLKDDLEHCEATGDVSDERKQEFYETYKNIFDDLNETWESVRSE